MIELIPPLIGVLIMFDILRYLDKQDEIKFKNEILDLDGNKEHSLNDIKSIFSDIFNFNVTIDELSEYNIKRIQRLLDNVKGNLTKRNTKYYHYSIIVGILIELLKKQKVYANDKDQLISSISKILKELEEEKKFFGLNARETEIFIDLTKNKNLSEADYKSILELKDIVINRYQELIKRDEQSDRLSKRSIRLGYISLLITAVSVYYSFFSDKFAEKDAVKNIEKQVIKKNKT